MNLNPDFPVFVGFILGIILLLVLIPYLIKKRYQLLEEKMISNTQKLMNELDDLREELRRYKEEQK